MPCNILEFLNNVPAPACSSASEFPTMCPYAETRHARWAEIDLIVQVFQ